jgi:hypothetical protein
MVHAIAFVCFAASMLDLTREHRIPLSDAPKHPLLKREGRPIHRSVLERWRTHGIRGVILETVKIGGIRYTSAEAIERFIERQNTPGADNETVTQSQLARQHSTAERELAAAGM